MTDIIHTLRPGCWWNGARGIVLTNCTLMNNTNSILKQFDAWFDREVEIAKYFERKAVKR